MKKVYLLNGIPGAGKGFVINELKSRFNLFHLSTGNVFRKMKADGELESSCISIMERGDLLPNVMANDAAANELAKASASDCEFVFLDGYPRNMSQMTYFRKLMSAMSDMEFIGVIDLVSDEKAVEARVVNRRVCPACGRTYNLISAKPLKEGICDDCGAALIQRADDSVETFKKRLDVHRRNVDPVIDFSISEGINVFEVSNVPGEQIKTIVEIIETYR